MIKNGQHTFIVLFDLISFFKIAQMQINGIFAQIQLLMFLFILDSLIHSSFFLKKFSFSFMIWTYFEHNLSIY